MNLVGPLVVYVVLLALLERREVAAHRRFLTHYTGRPDGAL